MGRENNRCIAQETMQIIKHNFYMLRGKKIFLPNDPEYYEEVEVFTPSMVKAIVNDEDEFFERSFYGRTQCEYHVVNMDSYEANQKLAFGERTLVMNFANAHHPGGGFLNGASAQEESLCRCSTLFASISSASAAEMYRYNNENRNPFDSDYILISPHVEVFRRADGSILENGFQTAVLTIPAQNLHGLARGVDRALLAEQMEVKIEALLMVAARRMYGTLVLGAWGCGAFGHDAKDVSEYFKNILVREKFYQFFDKIIFAVYDKTAEKYNYKTFLETFGESGFWKDDND